jgi:rhodanese-related sulfurtransferase
LQQYYRIIRLVAFATIILGRNYMTQTITRDEINVAINKQENITLVEALPEKYFNDAHLPGAIQINYDEVIAKAAKLPADKEAKIVVYCSNSFCNNSGKAAIALTQLGYSNVYKYAEGKQDWIESGLPIEKSH